jgi:RNA polymerase sigma-70 factor (ECF subfamily)
MTHDKRLVEAAQTGDQQAMATLYQAHVQDVYRYVYARIRDTSVAEDITSEVFVRALETLAAYQQRGIPFLMWLFHIAGGKIVDYYRWAGRRKGNLPLDEAFPAAEDTPEQITSQNEQVRHLMSSLNQLTESHQQVLTLRFVQGKSLEQTAAAMGKNENAIKALQFRATQALEKLMKENR